MDTSKHLTAYNVRTKQKARPILDAVISKTARGAYMAQGHDDDESKTRLTALITEAKAIAAVEDGVAEWAPGAKPNPSSL